MKKVLAVCGMGLGTGLVLRMQTESALRELGVDAEVEVADIGSARGQVQGVDVVVTSAELAEELGQVDATVVTVTNFVDGGEIKAKLADAVGEQ